MHISASILDAEHLSAWPPKARAGRRRSLERVAAYVRSWARLVGLDSPEAAERVFGSLDERQVEATLGLLDMCLVFGDEPIFTRGERPH
jgi:hypothetical protein